MWAGDYDARASPSPFFFFEAGWTTDDSTVNEPDIGRGFTEQFLDLLR